MGAGGFLTGLTQGLTGNQIGANQGALQGNQIAYERQRAGRELALKEMLDKAQAQEAVSRGHYFEGLNPTKEAVAGTIAGGRTDVADITADSRRDVAGVNVAGRQTVAGMNADTRIKVANINAQVQRARIAAMGKSQGTGLATLQYRMTSDAAIGDIQRYQGVQGVIDAAKTDVAVAGRLRNPAYLSLLYKAAGAQDKQTTSNNLRALGITFDPDAAETDVSKLGGHATAADPTALAGATGNSAVGGGATGGRTPTPGLRADDPNWVSSQGYTMDELRQGVGGQRFGGAPVGQTPPASQTLGALGGAPTGQALPTASTPTAALPTPPGAAATSGGPGRKLVENQAQYEALLGAGMPPQAIRSRYDLAPGVGDPTLPSSVPNP